MSTYKIIVVYSNGNEDEIETIDFDTEDQVADYCEELAFEGYKYYYKAI